MIKSITYKCPETKEDTTVLMNEVFIFSSSYYDDEDDDIIFKIEKCKSCGKSHKFEM